MITKGAILITAALLSSAAEASASFASVRRVLDVRCVACHGHNKKEHGVDLSTYAGVRKTVLPGDPMGSQLYRVVALKLMPPHNYKLTPEELAVLANWIAAGAKDK